VQYLDVGTIVNILPERLDGDNVLLNVSMSISSIIGTSTIGGNPYPIQSRRAFTYQVIVKSGFSLAVGGLEEAIDQSSNSSVPGLGKIPFFGYFFSQKDRSRSRRNLMMFVTPKMLVGYEGNGISASPMSTIPARGPRPSRKTLHDGGASASAVEIKVAAIDIRTDIDEITAKANEGRIVASDMTMLEVISNELDLMGLRVQELKRAGENVVESLTAIADSQDLLATARARVKIKNAHLSL
jgi:SepF-like predicted cell division protein (DUF552 family)